MSLYRHVWAGLLILVFSGCAYQASSPQSRRDAVDQLVLDAGWQSLALPTQAFVLRAYAPVERPVAVAVATTLTIYVEGDGLSWLSKSRVSPDPTPKDPVGLRLALGHPHGTAAYLARPCQYVRDGEARGCDEKYWTRSRFAAEVIAAGNQAVDELKQRFGVHSLVLVGYSGGGAIAALVAAQRTDILGLITVAGNLDHAAWTRLHHVSPLDGSLNPADAWQALTGIPQLHLVGADDRNVSPEIAEAYGNRFPAGQRPEIRVIPGFDHACCWVDQWEELAGGWMRRLKTPDNPGQP